MPTPIKYSSVLEGSGVVLLDTYKLDTMDNVQAEQQFKSFLIGSW